MTWQNEGYDQPMAAGREPASNGLAAIDEEIESLADEIKRLSHRLEPVLQNHIPETVNKTTPIAVPLSGLRDRANRLSVFRGELSEITNRIDL